MNDYEAFFRKYFCVKTKWFVEFNYKYLDEFFEENVIKTADSIELLKQYAKQNSMILSNYIVRDACVKYWSWAITDGKAVERIAKEKKIVEVGAGMGWWAQCLSDAGAEVKAFDDFSWRYKPRWFDVRHTDELNLDEFQDCALLLVWPPYDSPMMGEYIRRWKGEKICIVGEKDGCCGNREDWDWLEENFVCEDEVNMLQWDGIHDYLSIWRAK